MSKKHVKLIQMKKLVDASYESNIKTNVEEYVSSENIHFDDACCW